MARPPVSLHALAAARGDVPADILLKGGRVLSPTTREWVTTDLAIADGVVVGWGERDAHESINVEGASLVAGFVDAHMHLESSKLWVDEYVKAVLPNGTAIVMDMSLRFQMLPIGVMTTIGNMLLIQMLVKNLLF